MPNGLEGYAAQDALAEGLDDFTILDESSELDTVSRAAILLGDDGVLRDVDKTAGHVTRVGRLERGVCKALTGAVSRDEVLETGQTFAEVCHNWRLDDLTRGLRHEAAHTGELTHLLSRATSARVGHDVDRVERLLLFGLAIGLGDRDELDLLHHGRGDLFRRTRPDVEYFVVLLA